MILVTGITGHSGRWFLERLKNENYPDKVRCIVRNTSDTSVLDNCRLHIEKVVGDINDDDFLEKVLCGVDTVLHIVGIPWSEQILHAAMKNDVKWLILIHTTGRFSKYKQASAEYIRIEESLLEFRNQISITIARPTMIYGSARDMNMYKLVDYLYHHRLFPIFGRGDNLMQPVHARDLGNAYYDILTHRAETIDREYNLSGKYPIKYIDIIRTVAAALTRKVVILYIPMQLSILAARVYCFIFKQRALINVEQVMRMNEDKDFSYEDAQRDFGYHPMSFEEGIKDEVQQFLQSKQNTG